jgi:hypothetical protein
MTTHIFRRLHRVQLRCWTLFLGALLLSPAPAQVDPAENAPPRVEPSTKPMVVAAGKPVSADPAPALQLVFRTVVLPAGRLEMQYNRQIVAGGTAPYTFEVLSGQLPDGLELTSDGRLTGLPIAARSHRFVLEMRDAATPPLTIQQAYSLRIEARRSPPKPAPAPEPLPQPPPAPAPPAPAPAEPAIDLARAPVTLQDQQRAGWVRIYRLNSEAVAGALAPPPPDAPRVELPQSWLEPATLPVSEKSEPFEVTPNPERVQAMLQPLLGIEYPTRELFQRALQATRCAYLVAIINTAAGKADPSLTCSLERLEKGARGFEAPWRPLYDELLPRALERRLLESAARLRDPTQAKPVHWRGADCGCITENPDLHVYGFYSHWSAQEQPQAVDFSQFTRISYLGASLNDAGGYDTPPHWNSESTTFARTAHRYGTKLDLVVYRRDWQLLARQTSEEQERFARSAAANAVQLINEPLTDRFTRLKPYLLPGWTESFFLYDGVTVFFDDAPTDAAGEAHFASFFRHFMRHLIQELQKTGRSLALNLVVPQQLLGQPGAYSFEDLVGYIETAEPPYSRRIPEGGTDVTYRGTTDISVALLVMLSEPTIETNRQLRARIDSTNVFQGHRRIAFLNGVMPVLLHATAAEPLLMSPAQRTLLDADLAYTEWQYGGIGFWPVPLAASGTGAQVIELLGHNFYPPESASVAAGICKYVCPNRSVLRLLLEALALVSGVATALYVGSCNVRRLGRSYLLGLWATASVTLLIGLALLSCDPDLSVLRSGNRLLYALLAMVVAAGAYFTLKPKVSLP